MKSFAWAFAGVLMTLLVIVVYMDVQAQARKSAAIEVATQAMLNARDCCGCVEVAKSEIIAAIKNGNGKPAGVPAFK